MRVQFTAAAKQQRKLLPELYPAFLAKVATMHYVYVLQSERDKEKIYIGRTDDINRRLNGHNRGDNYSTRNSRPYRIVYYEAYLHKDDAISREHKLKHHGSVIGHLKKRIQESLIF